MTNNHHLLAPLASSQPTVHPQRVCDEAGRSSKRNVIIEFVSNALAARLSVSPPLVTSTLSRLIHARHHERVIALSTGHRYGEEKPERELFQMLGEGDTPTLIARKVALDTGHDVPYGGGNSVDGKTVYIDRLLYRELMDYRTQVRGVTARQVVQAFCEHEHTEWAVDAGDNPVDVYLAAHGFAIAAEHRSVRMLRIDPEQYERCIAPALKRCLKRDPENPPRDLWCGPYLDQPNKRDLELLRIFRAKGVVDAFKVSKIEAEYGIGANECHKCRYYGGGEFSKCEKVCGIVRATRQCDWWTAKLGRPAASS